MNFGQFFVFYSVICLLFVYLNMKAYALTDRDHGLIIPSEFLLNLFVPECARSSSLDVLIM
jgi:hypothetical protein